MKRALSPPATGFKAWSPNGFPSAETSGASSGAGTTTDARPGGQPAGLGTLFEALDRRLAEALEDAERRLGGGASADPYRGLYLAPEDVEQSLSRPPGAPAYPPRLPDAVAELGQSSSSLARLGRDFALSPFELAALLVTVAPELDLRYERIYAFLQDDVSRRRPTLDLVLSLLCTSTDEKLQRRRHFEAGAPLLRHGLLELSGDAAFPDAPLLARDLSAAAPVQGYLLGTPGPDARLAPVLLPPPPANHLPPLPAAVRSRLSRAARRALDERRPLRLCFRGPVGSGRHATARQIARAAGTELLALDPSGGADEVVAERLLRRALLEARLRGWTLYLVGFEAVAARWGEGAARRMLSEVERHPAIVILGESGDRRTAAAFLPELVEVSFGATPFRRRRAAWRGALARAGLPVTPSTTEALATRFDLSPFHVFSAVRVACSEEPDLASADSSALERRLFSAARAQAGRKLGEQARRVEPVFNFSDLVLPPDGKRQLRELCQRVEHRRRVLDEWGFGARLPLGAGVNALFAGPSGTGKTMAAQVVAGALGLDLYRIDLSQVVDKFIGETEKNLGRIFDQAESSNAILFFDEADALFGKRSEVKDSHDRYANIEIGYLLQKMEEYRGITILATNLRQNMDDAFVRRLAFHVHFPFPDEGDRIRIWKGVLPRGVPLDPDVDLDFLGRRFKVSGGNIRNIALAGAFLAADEGTPLAMRHLVQGVRREFQKMGKVCVHSDFEPYFELLGEVEREGTAA